VDPISGRSADQASWRSPGRARDGGSPRPDLRGPWASHPAALVAGGVFALTVLALLGLWTRAGTGVALGASTILPSTLIAVLAVAAVASTYRLGHSARPALVRSGEPARSATPSAATSSATVTALARANAAHMAGVSHIRIIEREISFQTRALPDEGTPHGRSAS
jgi:hypothetical protein